MKKMRRGFSLFLSMVLVLGMLPVRGYAEDCAHELTYAAEGDSVIVESCANEGCGYRETATLMLDPEASLVYTGKEVKPLKVEYSKGWQGEQPEIVYSNNIQVTKPQEAPVEPVTEEAPETESQPASEETAPETETEPQNPEETTEPTEPEEPKIPVGKLTIGGITLEKYFEVDPTTLIITATATVSYGDEKPEYTLVCTDAEGEEKKDILTVTEGMLTSDYTQYAPVDSQFEIRVNLEGITLEQYDLEPKNGSFKVEARELEIDWGTLAFPYDGEEHLPEPVIKNAVAGEDVKLVVNGTAQKTVGNTYGIEISLDGTDKDNYKLQEAEKQFAITPRELQISWDKLEFEYDGKPHLPAPTITNLVEGDEVTLDWEPKEGKTAADTYEITILGLDGADAGNYALPANTKATFTISLPAQEAPVGVKAEAETIFGKADGKITGVTEGMEYKLEGAESYTQLTQEEIEKKTVEGLAVGTYLVRYAEIPNEKAASKDVEVTVEEGASLTVTLPAAKTGYTLTTDKNSAKWDESVTLTFALAAGYVRTDDFAVKVNDNAVKLDKNGKYTIEKMQENAVVTVVGITPAITMELMGVQYNTVLDNITFEKYSKTTQTLTITSAFGTEGIYYTETAAMTNPAEIADEKWLDYEEAVKIENDDRKAVFYAKVTDGNDVYYASTNGVVFDTTAPVVGIKSGVYYTTQKVKISDSNLEEVTVETTEGTKTTKQTFTAQNGAKEIVITLKGNVDASYKIIAKDKAGNTTGESSVIRVNMDPITNLTTTKAGLDKVDTLLDDANATTAEKTELKKIKDNKDIYLVILQIQALPEEKDVQPYNETHRDAYDAAQKAYDALTTEQKKLVATTETDHLSAVKDALAYEITTDEDDLQWEKKSQVDFVLKANGPDARFKELQIAGKAVATTKYTHAADTYGTKITIDEAYLDTLTTGKKTIKVVYTDGETDGKDQLEIVKAGTNPKTGDDGIRFWMTASVLSLACLAAVACCGRKRRYQA